MKTIIIVDDNQIQLKKLADMITEACSDMSLLCYSNTAEFLDDIRSNAIHPDILFMDIQLGQDNGIAISETVLDYAPDCQVVFVSGYDDYYLDVYDVDHVFFIRKPATPEAVSKAIAKACRGSESARNSTFSIEFNGQSRVVNVDQILYFEHYKRVTTVYLSNGASYQFYMPLKEVHSKLQKNFIRCHASFIVNLNKVDSYRRDEFIIRGKRIPVSRRYRDIAREAFMDSL